MQFVAAAKSPQTVEAGHQAAELPLAEQPFHISLHAIAAGASATWRTQLAPPVLVVLDGIGKVTIDGAPLRLSAPCTLCVPAGAEVRVSNQGGVTMRLLAITACDPGAPPQGGQHS